MDHGSPKDREKEETRKEDGRMGNMGKEKDGGRMGMAKEKGSRGCHGNGVAKA